MGLPELAVVGLVGSGVGVALGAPMVWSRAGDAAPASRILGAPLVLTGVLGGLISARLSGAVAPSASVEHAINLLGLLGVPCVPMYIEQVTTGTLSLRPWRLWMPAMAYLVLVLVQTAANGESHVPFAWLFPVVLAFTAISAAKWRQCSPALRQSALVPPGWLVALLVLVNVAQLARMTFGHVPFVRAAVPLALSAGFLMLVAVCATRLARSGASPPRYEHSGLDESAARDIVRRVDVALSSERLFARPDLTLAQLAEAVACTPHQVSEALNRFAGTSFRDLLQRRRVDDVKAQLLEHGSERFTIEGIGASAGFGSRSALYAAFRRIEGVTPAEFRAAMRRTIAAGA